MTHPLEAKCQIGDLEFDCARHVIRSTQGAQRLTAFEAQVLAYFVENANRPVSIDELAERVWGHQFVAQTGVYKQLVRRLRKKLRSTTSKVDISFSRGSGYRLTAASASSP